MKTHHYLLFLLLLPLFLACGGPKDRVRIKGEIAGIKQADFYVYSEDGKVGGIDTIHIVDGKFRYERVLSEPAILTFLYPNFSRTYFIAEPGKELKVNGSASKLKSIDISGSKENELLTKFRLDNATRSDKEGMMAAAQFVRDNAETMAAIAVFKRYFAHAENRDGQVSMPLLDKLKAAQPESEIVASMEDHLRGELRTALGNTLPDFKAVTLNGDTVRRADFKGKPLLVVAWAPWCSDSYRVTGVASKLEHKYHDRLRLLLVSVDFDKKVSKVRMEQDDIRSPFVCEGRGFASPLVETLGIRYVPGNLFVNAEGEIIKRDVPVDRLEKEVQSWLK